MNKTQEEFTKAVYETIKDKAFFSNISEEMAEVVEKLPEEIVPGKVLFDGMMLFDGIEGIEDDIQQMHSFLKDGTIVNLEDYYTDNGAFDNDGWDRFMTALERLMTVNEFFQYLENMGDLPENPEDYNDLALYPIDENGHAEIPAGTIYIKDEAFINCSKLVSVTIPDTVLEIGGLAFGGCTNLASVELPSSVRFIGPSAFTGCKSLARVIISTSVSIMIEERAFEGCISLTDVVFTKNPIKVILRHAFEGCPCEDEIVKNRYFEFKTVKQMVKAVKDAISSGSLHFHEELDGRTLVYHTKKFKERIAFEYRNNKIFYTIYAHNTVYDSWTIHEEKVLEYFFKLYESTK
jgi:hypothetical protein